MPRFFTRVARSITKHPKFWIRLANLESKVLAPDLMDRPVVAPVYVCGLARAGSTLMLEFLAGHKDAASHRYQDFPFIFTPYWWQLVLKLSPFKDEALRERAHGDRMLVNSASPEAMEEMLWMAFFPQLHDDSRSNVLGRKAAGGKFDAFYRKHLEKLLLAGKASRYVSKGNYNVTRMAYLHQLFPDARFIVPVRGPEGHIASLMRQHERFCAASKEDPDVAEHMALAGHLEFGPRRTPIHTGETGAMDAVKAAWAAGDEVLGWAHYWAMIYRFVAGQLAADKALAEACLIVRFEELCANPREVLKNVFAHCRLEVSEEALAAMAAKVSAPDYYDAGFTPQQREQIAAACSETAKALGY